MTERDLLERAAKASESAADQLHAIRVYLLWIAFSVVFIALVVGLAVLGSVGTSA